MTVVTVPEGLARRRWARVLIQAGLTLGITYGVLRVFEFEAETLFELDRGWIDPSWLSLGGATVLLFLCYVLATRFWGWMTGELGERDPGTRASLQIVLAANLGRYLPGKVWQLAGLAVLARRRGISASTATAASLLVQGFALSATVLWGIPFLFLRAGIGAGDPSRERTMFIVALGLLATTVLLTSFPVVTRWGIRILFRLARRDPSEAPKPGPGFGARWVAWNVVLWGAYGMAFVLFVRGLGFTVPVLPVLSAFSAAYLMGYLAVFAPAGIGVREGMLAGLLFPYLGEGALAVAMLTRLWMTAVEVIPAGFALAAEFRDVPSARGKMNTALDPSPSSDGARNDV